MTQPIHSSPLSQDDQRLVSFLKQHRPMVPQASPELEFRLMQAVEQERRQNQVPETIVASRRQRSWLRWTPPAITALLLLVWVGYRAFTPPSLTPQQVADLESFMENTWEGSISHNPEVEPALLLGEDNPEL